MTLADIVAQRLHTQYLLGHANSPLEVVRVLGAVQAQDFLAAKWAIGQRCNGKTDREMTQLYNDGKILRTHMLRPTWHFVLPQDIRWMLALTSPRVQAFAKNYYKKIDLSEATLRHSAQILARELQGAHLTRKQIKEVYEHAGIDTTSLRLGFLILYAELEAVICSGAMQGKHHTYALLHERAAQAEELSRDEALSRLAKRFFAGHGPATARDFSWWASLLMADVLKGIELAGLQSVEVGGKTYYFDKMVSADIPSPTVHMLSNFDEFTIAYKDREVFTQAKLQRQPSYEDLSHHLLMCDGQLVGGWKWQHKKEVVKIELDLFRSFSVKQKRALEHTVAQLQSFVEKSVDGSFTKP